MATVEEILADLRRQQEESRTANETRYQDILKLYEGQGESDVADVEKGTAEELGTIQQGLVSRGLASSGALEAYQGEARSRGSREKARIREAVARDKAGVMERRTDAYPDQGLYAQLLNQLGEAQGSQNQERRHETIGAYAGGGGAGGGGGGSRGGGENYSRAGGAAGGSSGGYGSGGEGGGGGGYSSAGRGGRYATSRGGAAAGVAGAGATPGGGVAGFFGSYQGSAAGTGGTILTGEDAVRFGGAGTRRVSLPPMIASQSYTEAGRTGGAGTELYGPGYRAEMGPPMPPEEAATETLGAGAMGETKREGGPKSVRAIVSRKGGEDVLGEVPIDEAEWSANQQKWFKRGVA